MSITEASAKAENCCWTQLPLFHYDPRRWMEKAEKPESWETPFSFINTTKKAANPNSPFIGFKTYTSLGYMPLDPALPHQSLFYDRCENEGIPIMNHCTTEGMYTHDKPFYYDLWKKDPILKHLHTLDPLIERIEKELTDHIRQLKTTVVDFRWKEKEKQLLLKKVLWFDRHYVFPSAWEPVVAKRKNLKLCLAHFCGYNFFGDRHFSVVGHIPGKKFKNGFTDEETEMIYGFPKTEPDSFPDPQKTNPLIYGLCKLLRPDNQVHFDVSFFFVNKYNLEAIQNFYHWAKGYAGTGPEKTPGFILDRMLWGSDWPLLATDHMKGKDLKSNQLKGYVDMNAKEWMAIDPELWFRMAVVNPVRFYNLKGLRPHLEVFFEKAKIPEAFKDPALTMAEIYAKREKVMG